MKKLIKICLTLCLWGLLFAPYQLLAQEDGDWTIPKQIPGYDNEATVFLLTDSSGAVHAFSTKILDGQQVIVYSRWVYGQGWTDPNDVILPPLKGQIRLQGAVLDSFDVAHLAFFSGDETGAGYYYASASIVSAGNAWAWSKPDLIGDNAIAPDTAAFTIDSNNHLLLLYSSNLTGNGLYAVRSLDRGQTWSNTAVNIFQTYNRDLYPWYAKLYTDEMDMVHAVWSVVGPEGTSLAVYYSNLSSIASGTWSTPLTIAEAEGYEADTPAIIRYKGELFLIYHNQVPTRIFLRRSKDNGATWSEPVRVAPQHVGGNGPGAFLVDSNNKLYMFFGNRTGDAQHGMWYVTWEGEKWSEVQAVNSRILVRENPGGNGFDPSFAQTQLVLGNLIFLTWVTDPAAGKNGVWYVYKELNIPPLATKLPATPIPTVQPTSAPTVQVVATSIRSLSAEQSVQPLVGQGLGPSQTILLGISPAILLALLIISYKIFKT